jgi:hypothetical protein
MMMDSTNIFLKNCFSPFSFFRSMRIILSVYFSNEIMMKRIIFDFFYYLFVYAKFNHYKIKMTKLLTYIFHKNDAINNNFLHRKIIY